MLTTSGLLHSLEAYSTDSSRMIRNPPEASNFNRFFLKLNRFICNGRFSRAPVKPLMTNLTLGLLIPTLTIGYAPSPPDFS